MKKLISEFKNNFDVIYKVLIITMPGLLLMMILSFILIPIENVLPESIKLDHLYFLFFVLFTLCLFIGVTFPMLKYGKTKKYIDEEWFKKFKIILSIISQLATFYILFSTLFIDKDIKNLSGFEEFLFTIRGYALFTIPYKVSVDIFEYYHPFGKEISDTKEEV